MEDGLYYSETTDHICRVEKDVSAGVSDLEKVMFKCGGCREELRTICQLHEHLIKEFLFGSYLYNHNTRTAFPVNASVSKGTQTECQYAVKDDQYSSSDCQSSRKSVDRKIIENESDLSKDNLNNISDNTTLENENKELKNVRKRKYVKRKIGADLREGVSKKAKTRKSNLSKIDLDRESKEEVNNDVKQLEKFHDSPDREAVLLTYVKQEVLDNNYGDSTDENVDNFDELEFKVNGHSEEKVSVKKKNRVTKKKIGTSSKFNKSCTLKKYVKVNDELIEASEQENKKSCSPDSVLENDFDEGFNSTNTVSDVKKRGHSRFKTEKFTCEHCDTVFHSEKRYNMHLYSVHKPIYPFSCKTCNFKTFTNKEEFKKHKEQHPKQVYNCELCGKQLKSREGLKLHEYIHSGEKPFCCDQCDYRGRTSTQLRQHMYTHMDSKTEQCEHCGKAFFTKAKLKEHLRYCRKEFNHHCPHCQKGFPTASGLRKHILMHTGERAFVCDVCGFATFRITLLNSHMRTHTGEKPHKCKECGARLATRGTLLLHLRTHTHEKPFVCSYCSKAFTSKWNLQTHLRQHTGETPYKCDICGQGFKQNVLRKAHMRSHLECPSIEPDTVIIKEHSTDLHSAIDPDDRELVPQRHKDSTHSQEPDNISVDNRSLEPDKIHLTNFMYDRNIDGEILNQSLQSEKINPLDLKLHYSSASDIKGIYDHPVINSHQLHATSFDMINYPDIKHV